MYIYVYVYVTTTTGARRCADDAISGRVADGSLIPWANAVCITPGEGGGADSFCTRVAADVLQGGSAVYSLPPTL